MKGLVLIGASTDLNERCYTHDEIADDVCTIPCGSTAAHVDAGGSWFFCPLMHAHCVSFADRAVRVVCEAIS